MATKVYLNTSRHGAPAALVTMSNYMIGIAGVTGFGFKGYKNIDHQSVVPIMRSYVSVMNSKGQSIPVLKNIDDSRIPSVLKAMSTALNVIKP